jgi:hypothetical protein
MSNQISSNAPMMQDNSTGPFYHTWVKALTKPNESTYAEIAGSPNAKATTAYLWVFLSSLVASFFSLLVQQLTVGSRLSQAGFGDSQFGNGFGTIAITVICGAPIAAAIGTMFFALIVALIQWIAKMFGGRGTNDQLAYVYAAIGVPYSLISSIFILLAAIPYVGICFNVILGLAGLYVLVLQIMAVKAINQFGWGPALGSVLLPGVGLVIVCGCLFGGLFVLMGPAIKEVFQQINQSLAP